MILKEFPDYQWLKKQSESAFENRQGWHRMPLDNPGWPTVILNTKTPQSYRPDIKGTFSLFCNISGKSHIKADHYQIRLDEACFFITNESQYYSLIIDSKTPTETFNIHFGSAFFADLVHDYFSSKAASAVCSESILVFHPPRCAKNSNFCQPFPFLLCLPLAQK